MTLCKIYNAIFDCVAGCPKLVTNTVHKHLSGKHLPTLPSRSCPHSESSMGLTDSLPVLLHPRSLESEDNLSFSAAVANDAVHDAVWS